MSDRAWLAGLLEAERALAQAHARAGTISEKAAAAVVAACDPASLDAGRLAGEGRESGNPVVPLVRELRERVGPEHADAVHLGATSQDILDSAAMLVAREALRLVDGELGRVADACARLARDHRGSVMAARTLLQQAVPTTFGYKAAGWLVGTIETRGRLVEAGEGAGKLGGVPGRSPPSASTEPGSSPCSQASSACASRRFPGTRSACRSSSSAARSQRRPRSRRRSRPT